MVECSFTNEVVVGSNLVAVTSFAFLKNVMVTVTLVLKKPICFLQNQFVHV